MAVSGDGLNEALFPKFAELVFRLRHAVTEGDQNIAGIEFNRLFLVFHVIEEPYDGSAGIETARGAVFAKDDWRQMTSIGVNHAAGFVVIKAEEQGGVLFRLRARVDVAIQEPQHLCRRRTRQPRGYGRGSRALAVLRYSSHGDQLFLSVSADRRVNCGHEQCRGDAFAADVAHGNTDLLRAIREKVVIITADDSRRTANAVQLKRAHSRGRLR